MFLVILLIILANVIGLGILFAATANAPEGYEDETGFHFAAKDQANRVMAAAPVQHSRSDSGIGVGDRMVA